MAPAVYTSTYPPLAPPAKVSDSHRSRLGRKEWRPAEQLLPPNRALLARHRAANNAGLRSCRGVPLADGCSKLTCGWRVQVGLFDFLFEDNPNIDLDATAVVDVGIGESRVSERPPHLGMHPPAGVSARGLARASARANKSAREPT